MRANLVAAALVVISTNAFADIDDYTGQYTAVQVCDDHADDSTFNKGAHALLEGKFIIASFEADENKQGHSSKKAVIIDAGGFSKYDWSDLRLEFVPGKTYPGVILECPEQSKSHSVSATVTIDGNKIGSSATHNFQASLGKLGYEHLSGEIDLHKAKGSKKHVVRVYAYKVDGFKYIYIVYGEKEGGVHAGHVHN